MTSLLYDLVVNAVYFFIYNIDRAVMCQMTIWSIFIFMAKLRHSVGENLKQSCQKEI